MQGHKDKSLVGSEKIIYMIGISCRLQILIQWQMKSQACNYYSCWPSAMAAFIPRFGILEMTKELYVSVFHFFLK